MFTRRTRRWRLPCLESRFHIYFNGEPFDCRQSTGHWDWCRTSSVLQARNVHNFGAPYVSVVAVDECVDGSIWQRREGWNIRGTSCATPSCVLYRLTRDFTCNGVPRCPLFHFEELPIRPMSRAMQPSPYFGRQRVQKNSAVPGL